jgi:hypothetical protein
MLGKDHFAVSQQLDIQRWQAGLFAGSTVRCVLGAALALASVACGPDERQTPEALSVELGTGEAEFIPISGEPTLDMAAGFQGGFHVWVSLLAKGFSDAIIDVELFTQFADDPSNRLRLGGPLKFEEVTEDGHRFHRFVGYPGQVRNAACAHGKRVLIEVTLTDVDERQASDERYCVVSLDERYRNQNCE